MSLKLRHLAIQVVLVDFQLSNESGDVKNDDKNVRSGVLIPYLLFLENTNSNK